ncbi:hypothetical protein AB6A40_000147 [Gnathostoma spinigerum]|uniref:Peptidase C1A papain C-terminal domain-containing protein n=1 Tax=Gnathostoma spinigerum TaxID=75299 RepID=A0ABD6E9P6_9BILA
MENPPESKLSEVAIIGRKHSSGIWTKLRRISWTVLFITGLGILLLALILVCVIFETVKLSRTSSLDGPVRHTPESRDYHLRIVNFVNSLYNATWKAKYNKFASRFADEVANAEVTKIVEVSSDLPEEEMFGDTESHSKLLGRLDVNLPKAFDARKQWSLCWSMHQVPNQGGCGSCWALTAASVMSDRICIASNYTKQPQVSAQDLTSCCTGCGGCQGSYWALAPFTHWKLQGIVSGGNYGSFEGCKPYMMPPDCGTPCSLKYYARQKTPECIRKCQYLYDKEYMNDITKGATAYWVYAEGGSSDTKPAVKGLIERVLPGVSPAEILKKELYFYGPLLACFTVNEDFQHYGSGIYHTNTYNDSKELYGHCAKLLGWGEEGGVKFWTYMNTWGRDWGENGFFRVSLDEVPEEATAAVAAI